MQKKTKHIKTTRDKMRQSALIRDNTKRIESLPKGKKHWNWSEEPTKLTLHKRIHRKYGRASDKDCIVCGEKARDWALQVKKYSYDIKDYKPMCRKCHVTKDKGYLKRDWKDYKIIRNKKGQIMRVTKLKK